MQHHLAVAVLVASSVLACASDPVRPENEHAESNRFEVFTQNVYVGTDVDAVLGAPPEELESRLFAALATFAGTNWQARAEAIAARIATLKPAVVALNEVTTLTVVGLAPVFPDVNVEFLPSLQAALAARGASYVTAGSVENIDVTLQLGGPSIRLRDADAILVRSDLVHGGTTTGSYAAMVSVPLGPLGTVDLIRGWVSTNVQWRGNSVRIIATHLEPRSTAPALQQAQADELLGSLAGETGPVIILGDLNTDPAEPDPASPYRMLLDAGFQDGWLLSGGANDGSGYTCCHDPDLQDAVGTFDERIDHVFIRGRVGGTGPVRVLAADLFGDQEGERAAGGIWPSDHAGLYVRLSWSSLFR